MKQKCVECGKETEEGFMHSGYGWTCSIDPCYKEQIRKRMNQIGKEIWGESFVTNRIK